MPFGTDFDRKMSGNPWTRRPKISALEHGVADRRDAWVGLSSRPERLQASLGWKRQNHQRERNGALLRVLADGCFFPVVVKFSKQMETPTAAETTARTANINDGLSFSWLKPTGDISTYAAELGG